jgi:murein DD-endopeptidase MepM/ murein hydrolase activator NlpD
MILYILLGKGTREKIMAMKSKKKILKVMTLCLLLGSYTTLPSQEKNREEPPQIIVDLNSHSFQPGDVVQVTLRDSSELVKFVQMRFQDKKIPMIKTENFHKFIGFIGLDLDLKPGNFTLTLTLLNEDGEQQSKKEQIIILPKEFPVKKLWVDEKFVTPPEDSLERIKRESELLSAVYGMYTPMWMGVGEFIVPSEGEMAPNFGERRIFNNQPRSPHSGIDISSPFGADVKASNFGSVVVANDLYYSGKTVVIDHGLGVFSSYCHFSKINVHIGDQVSKGDVIGKIGATGRVTGPHLHWAFKVSGSRVNPLSILRLDFSKDFSNEK